MAPSRNNVIPNAHFHKSQSIKCWFDQPGRKARRNTTRVLKSKAIAPRPAAGTLKPVVNCPSVKYHIRVRGGRGFTLNEIKAAGLNVPFARSIGIAVDHRRRNNSEETLKRNVERIQIFKKKLILFPKHPTKKLQKGEATVDDCRNAVQLMTDNVIPIVSKRRTNDVPRAITEEEKHFNAFSVVKQARQDARLVGLRKIRAKLAEENPDLAKKIAAVKAAKKSRK